MLLKDQTQYNHLTDGTETPLTSLGQPRYYHACGVYQDTKGQKVNLSTFHMIMNLNSKHLGSTRHWGVRGGWLGYTGRTLQYRGNSAE